MAFDFPSDPASNPEVTFGDLTYKWDGEKWVVESAGTITGEYIPLNDWSTLQPLSSAP